MEGPPPKRSGRSKGDRKEVTLRIPTDLFDELERYSSYLNLRPNDAVELAIANMISQAKVLGADYPLARPWMDTEFKRGSRPEISSCASPAVKRRTEHPPGHF